MVSCPETSRCTARPYPETPACPWRSNSRRTPPQYQHFRTWQHHPFATAQILSLHRIDDGLLPAAGKGYLIVLGVEPLGGKQKKEEEYCFVHLFNLFSSFGELPENHVIRNRHPHAGIRCGDPGNQCSSGDRRMEGTQKNQACAQPRSLLSHPLSVYQNFVCKGLVAVAQHGDQVNAGAEPALGCPDEFPLARGFVA